MPPFPRLHKRLQTIRCESRSAVSLSPRQRAVIEAEFYLDLKIVGLHFTSLVMTRRENQPNAKADNEA